VKDSGVKLREMKVDGGITVNKLCMQLQADIMQIDISRPVINETTALGAAYAAGLSVGVWSDQEVLRAKWQESARFQPDRQSPLATDGYTRWQKAITRTLDWVD